MKVIRYEFARWMKYPKIQVLEITKENKHTLKLENGETVTKGTFQEYGGNDDESYKEFREYSSKNYAEFASKREDYLIKNVVRPGIKEMLDHVGIKRAHLIEAELQKQKFK